MTDATWSLATESDSTGFGPVNFTWTGGGSEGYGTAPGEQTVADSVLKAVLARYFGSVKVDAERYVRDIGNVTREVIDRLAGAGGKSEIMIDFQASKAEGFDESEVRTIAENGATQTFKDLGFES